MPPLAHILSNQSIMRCSGFSRTYTPYRGIKQLRLVVGPCGNRPCLPERTCISRALMPLCQVSMEDDPDRRRSAKERRQERDHGKRAARSALVRSNVAQTTHTLQNGPHACHLLYHDPPQFCP